MRQAVSQISGQVVPLMCLTVTFINTTSYASSNSKAAWWGIQNSSQAAVHNIHQCKQTQSTALQAGFHSRGRQLSMLPCVLLFLTPQTSNLQCRCYSSVTVTYWNSWLQPNKHWPLRTLLESNSERCPTSLLRGIECQAFLGKGTATQATSNASDNYTSGPSKYPGTWTQSKIISGHDLHSHTISS